MGGESLCLLILEVTSANSCIQNFGEMCRNTLKMIKEVVLSYVSGSKIYNEIYNEIYQQSDF